MYFSAYSTSVNPGRVEPLPVNTEDKDKAFARASEEKTSIVFRTTSGALFRCKPTDADLLLQLGCIVCSNLTSTPIRRRDSTAIHDPSHIIESAPWPLESAPGGQCGVIDLARSQLPGTAPIQDDSTTLPQPADIRCARKKYPMVNQFAPCQVLTELSKSLEITCARGVMLNNLEGAEHASPSIECGQRLSLHDLPAHFHNDEEHPARTLASVLPTSNREIPPTAKKPAGASAGALATPTITYAQYEAMVKQFGDVLNGFAELRQAYQQQAANINELCRAIVGQQEQIQKLDLELQRHKADTGNGVLLWKISGVKQTLDNIRDGYSQQLISPLFYTSKGYALYGQIYLTGDSAHPGRNMGLSIGLVPSLYDPILPRQFRGAVRFEILGRHGEVIHQDVILVAQNANNLQNPQNNPGTSANCAFISQKKIMDKCLVDDGLFIRFTA